MSLIFRLKDDKNKIKQKKKYDKNKPTDIKRNPAKGTQGTPIGI